MLYRRYVTIHQVRILPEALTDVKGDPSLVTPGIARARHLVVPPKNWLGYRRLSASAPNLRMLRSPKTVQNVIPMCDSLVTACGDAKVSRTRTVSFAVYDEHGGRRPLG